MLASRRSLDGARVIDLFAGTGALGLEALSRGAAHVVFVESDRAALLALRENVHSLGFERASVIAAQRAERAVEALLGPFDLVLCDPPYALVREAELATLLSKVLTYCDPEVVFVLEHDAKDAPPTINGVTVTVTRRYGDTSLTFYEASHDTRALEKASSNDEDGDA